MEKDKRFRTNEKVEKAAGNLQQSGLRLAVESKEHALVVKKSATLILWRINAPERPEKSDATSIDGLAPPRTSIQGRAVSTDSTVSPSSWIPFPVSPLRRQCRRALFLHFPLFYLVLHNIT